MLRIGCARPGLSHAWQSACMTGFLHITERTTWQAAQRAGEFRMSTRGVTLEEEGFIHCSQPHQLRSVAEMFYGDLDDLVVLVIDPALVRAPVRYEAPDGGTEKYPHIYGALPIAAVTDVIAVSRDHAGRFVLPGDDEAEVWARMRAIYDGFLTGDTGAVDALLAPDVTIWDSAQFALARGLDQLRDLRARRTRDPGAPTVIRLDAADPVIDIWGDTALVRHTLVVDLSDGTRETVRNTSVWRRTESGWLAVHNHEDIAGGGALP
jgi:uncharacterized protein (DUF952 family)